MSTKQGSFPTMKNMKLKKIQNMELDWTNEFGQPKKGWSIDPWDCYYFTIQNNHSHGEVYNHPTEPMGIHKRLSLKPQTLGWSLHHFLVVTNCYKGGLDPQFWSKYDRGIPGTSECLLFWCFNFERGPFQSKQWSSGFPGICICKYNKIQSKIKYMRYGQNLWFAKRSLAKLVSPLWFCMVF